MNFDTTFDITLKVEWVELTEYSPKSDIKTHENAPKRPQLKDALSSGSNYDVFGQPQITTKGKIE